MTLNALSALGMQDIVKLYVKKELSDRMELVISKLMTVFWGVVCIFLAPMHRCNLTFLDRYNSSRSAYISKSL